MGIIHRLPAVLTNQIAAGEVIERPASVVKELVENALDAGASFIEVTIQAGGKKQIQVTDNGRGMDREDATLSLERHATSKISNKDDLFRLQSYGFRGEALASIAAVSRLTLSTKPATAIRGTRVSCVGGHEIKVSDHGQATGTIVEVTDLFFNVPARRQYLKSDATEYQHIITYLEQIALSAPAVGWRVYHNDKLTGDWPARESLADRIADLFPQDWPHFIPIHGHHPAVTVSGFIAHPNYTFKERRRQIFLVNRRAVNVPLAQKAIREAYARHLAPLDQPLYIMLLDVDPERLDVNVHPRKLEVRFADQQEIFRAARQAVTEALEQHFSALAAPPSPPPSSRREMPSSPRGTPTLFSTDLPASRPAAKAQPMRLSPSKPSHSPAAPYHLIGQLADSYLLAEKDGALWIFDQHAVHERLLYERLRTAWEQRHVAQQILLTPLMLPLDARQVAVLTEYQPVLQELGWDIEVFGGAEYLVRAVPSDLAHTNLNQVILEMLQELSEDQSPTRQHTGTEKILAYSACRAAVKFGDALTPLEQEKLLQDWSSLPLGYSCPHGRPVYREFTVQELRNLFKR